MQARMKQTAIIIPGAMDGLQSLAKAAEQSGVPKKKTPDLVHLRASQINGCSVCLDMTWASVLRREGGRDKRTPVRGLCLRLGRGASAQPKRTNQVTTAVKYNFFMISPF